MPLPVRLPDVLPLPELLSPLHAVRNKATASIKATDNKCFILIMNTLVTFTSSTLCQGGVKVMFIAFEVVPFIVAVIVFTVEVVSTGNLTTLCSVEEA